MTNSPESLERSVMRSSVMPSLKYSCSGSPLRLTKGSTAIEGLSGNANAGWVLGVRGWVLGGGKTRDQTAIRVPARSNRLATPTTAQLRGALLTLRGCGLEL